MDTSDPSLKPVARGLGVPTLLCVLLAATEAAAQASSVGGATARRLLPPVPTISEIQTVVRSTAPGLPAGYVERSFSISAGPITAQRYADLVQNWGYQPVSCVLYGLWTRGNHCADGVNPASFYPGSWVRHDPCSGHRWDRAYQVIVYGWDHSGVGEGGSSYAYYEYFTCSATKTYTTLFKVTGP